MQSQLYAREIYDIKTRLDNLLGKIVAVVDVKEPVIGNGSKEAPIDIDFSLLDKDDFKAFGNTVPDADQCVAPLPEKPQIIAVNSEGTLVKTDLPANLIHVDAPIIGDGTEESPLDVDFSELSAEDICKLTKVIPTGIISRIVGLEAHVKCADEEYEWCLVAQDIECGITQCTNANQSAVALACVYDAEGSYAGMGMASVFENICFDKVTL